MKHYALTFLLLLALHYNALAQDPFLTDYSYAYSSVNPALTGTHAKLRAESAFRMQWPKLSGNYNTMFVSADAYSRFGNPGMSFMYDAAGSGTIVSTKTDFNYAYGIKLFKDDSGYARVLLQPGIQASFITKKLDWNKLQFGDAIDPRRGFVYNTNEALNTTTRTNIDFAAGLLVMTKRISAGIAAFHLTEPDEGFAGQSSLPMRFVLHASGVFGNIDPHERRALRLVPSVLFMKQQDFEQLALMLSAHYRMASLGVGYRNQDAILFTAGYTFSHFTFAYAYDLTVSDLAGYTGGAHELHLRFAIWNENDLRSRLNLAMFN